MEQAKQEAFDEARLQVIKDGYTQAFKCINQGLSEDEAGNRALALDLYRQGRRHLLRAISVPSQGAECVGSSWDSARQMQEKMQETLNNITTRLAILETEGDLKGSGDVPAPTVSGAPSPGLYPSLPKEKPPRPLPPQVNGQPAGASSEKGGAGVSLPSSPMAAGSPSQPRQASQNELPPAYTPQAVDGHTSISYGTDTGEMSIVGDEFYSHSPSAPPSPQSLGEDGEELLFLPHGVQIFYVTPEGHVSAPSYPGYLRIVKFTSERSERMPLRPPAFLQVRRT